MKSNIACLLLSCVAVVGRLHASEAWPAFRGPNGSGVAEKARPPVKFGPTESAQWRIDAPWSPSSPCVWGNQIFLTTFHNDQLETRCHSTRDGRLLWSQPASAGKLEAFHQTEGSPAASTPATDGRRVVVYFGSVGLLCYDLKGRELWRHPLPTAETAGNFGSGTSPVILDDIVVLNRDLARSSSLLAVSLKDGRKLWETPRPDAPTS